MTAPAHKPLRVFCSYSRKDEQYLNELRTGLSGLIRRGLIEWWHDREIVPGWEWEEDIDKHLRGADIVLLLVSPDFMASDYAYEEEVQRAMERHKRGEARVIPIIVRRTDLDDAPFRGLQSLPTDLKPIANWDHRDDAWYDVVAGIRKAVQRLLLERQRPGGAARQTQNTAGQAAQASREATRHAVESLPDGQFLDETTNESGQTVQRSVDESGTVIETILDESGNLVDEYIVSDATFRGPDEATRSRDVVAFIDLV